MSKAKVNSVAIAMFLWLELGCCHPRLLSVMKALVFSWAATLSARRRELERIGPGVLDTTIVRRGRTTGAAPSRRVSRAGFQALVHARLRRSERRFPVLRT